MEDGVDDRAHGECPVNSFLLVPRTHTYVHRQPPNPVNAQQPPPLHAQPLRQALLLLSPRREGAVVRVDDYLNPGPPRELVTHGRCELHQQRMSFPTHRPPRLCRQAPDQAQQLLVKMDQAIRQRPPRRCPIRKCPSHADGTHRVKAVRVANNGKLLSVSGHHRRWRGRCRRAVLTAERDVRRQRHGCGGSGGGDASCNQRGDDGVFRLCTSSRCVFVVPYVMDGS